MIQEEYSGYLILAKPIIMKTGRFAVSATIEKIVSGKKKSKSFYADDNIHFILEIEAVYESINLGRNLINSNRIGF